MYENLVLFMQRLIRELEITKKTLEKFFQNKEYKTDLFKEVHEVLIRAKDIKSQFRKGITKIAHLNRMIHDIKRLNKYVKDVIKENADKEHFEKIIQKINSIEEKIVAIRAAALNADKENKPLKKELVYA